MLSMEQNTKPTQWKIVTLPRLQVDALIACFLLVNFGEEKFPGIKSAEYLFWINIPEGKNAADLEREGYILLDMGGGVFDHHIDQNGKKEKCMSQMVAEYLGIHKNQSIRKLLEYARRDDLLGKGTISNDPIDRAFGLSGLVNNLNRTMPDKQEEVLKTVMPLFIAHHIEEKKRSEDLPKEYEEKLKSGKAHAIVLETTRGQVKMAIIETDDIAMAGYLRAQRAIDIVVQKMSSGHVNIITQQKKMFDLSQIAALLRVAEAEEKGIVISVSEIDLGVAGRIEGVDEWYFDNRARTIQNGGIRPQWTNPTRLSLMTIGEIIKQASAIKI
jgi:hypothetical protein